MKSQGSLHERVDRLIQEDRFEEAMVLVDQMEPISDEAFQEILDAAPIDDEPVTDADRLAIARGRAVLAVLSSRAAPLVSGDAAG